jgi:hypothetical protein
MYLKSLRVKNVRLLAEQEFSFVDAHGAPRLWTVILGDNGLCKSTILQSIALAALGPKLASSVMRDAQGLRSEDRKKETASIDACFSRPAERGSDGIDGEALNVRLRIEPDRHDFVTDESTAGAAEHLDTIRARRAKGWFAVGYGVGRFLPRPGEVALPLDPTIDRIEGLFDVRHKMLGTDFYEALQAKRLGTQFSRVLREILLEKDAQGEPLLPWLSGVELRGHGGVDSLSKLLETNRFSLDVGGRGLKLRATALSDGYQGMLAWITDLLGHAFLEFGRSTRPDELQGLVLLDEIDLHLHPTWQRRLVPLLKRIFPRLQFIVTTHSPLVLAGFEREEVIRLTLEGSEVRQEGQGLEPGMLTASEILTNYFDVRHAGRPELIEKERRYVELKAARSLPRRQRTELDRLEQELRPYRISPEREELLSPEELLNVSS